MKIKGLTINDWVRYTESMYPFQALTVSCMGWVLPSTGGPAQNESHYEPIPLTDDILEINGMYGVNDGGGDYYYFPNCEFNLEPRYDSEGNEEYGLFIGDRFITISYVHQLQHILRDAGLEDLADNFKVE